MIIRSQNKRLIVNFANVSEVCIRDNSIGMGAIAGGVNFIGTYSTEEKAIKVLDMIVECYRSKSFTDGVVFQMPQDSEV